VFGSDADVNLPLTSHRLSGQEDPALWPGDEIAWDHRRVSPKHSSNVAYAGSQFTAKTGANAIARSSSPRGAATHDSLTALLAFPSEVPDEASPPESEPATIDLAHSESPETQTPTAATGSKRHVVAAFVVSASCLAGALLLIDRPVNDTNWLDHLETPAVYSGLSYSLYEKLERVDVRMPAVPKPKRRAEIAVATNDDETAVRQKIRSFEGAYRGLGLQNCVIAVTGEQATADCRGTLQPASTVDEPAPASLHQQWLFRMQREGQAWKIAEVSRSPIASLPE
jgi:hypothetical protein